MTLLEQVEWTPELRANVCRLIIECAEPFRKIYTSERMCLKASCWSLMCAPVLENERAEVIKLIEQHLADQPIGKRTLPDLLESFK